MYINKVEICGVDTSKLPVLTNAQMQELFVRIKDGDKSAREEFIQGNLRLVLSVIKRFNNRGEMLDDLFQIGCIGLIKALDNFDVSHNVRFSTYAVPMIIGEIRRYLRDNNSIRVSRSLRDIAYKALQARATISNEQMRDATIEEISKLIEISVEDIVFALDAIQDPISLFEPIYSDGGDAIYVIDQVGDEKENEDSWLDNLSINQGLHKINPREKQIIQMRFFNGKTQMEVATEIGISQAQVSRLEKSALKHMRKHV